MHQCDQGMLPNWKSVFGYISLRRPILLHSWHFYHIVCNQGTQLTAVVRSGKAVVVTGGNGVGDKALTVMNAADALSLTYTTTRQPQYLPTKSCLVFKYQIRLESVSP